MDRRSFLSALGVVALAPAALATQPPHDGVNPPGCTCEPCGQAWMREALTPTPPTFSRADILHSFQAGDDPDRIARAFADDLTRAGGR